MILFEKNISRGKGRKKYLLYYSIIFTYARWLFIFHFYWRKAVAFRLSTFAKKRVSSFFQVPLFSICKNGIAVARFQSRHKKNCYRIYRHAFKASARHFNVSNVPIFSHISLTTNSAEILMAHLIRFKPV